jgi:Flp pilus assembly protein TadB
VTTPHDPTGTRATGVTGATDGADQRSLGDLVSDVTGDLSRLFKQEVELAKTELKQELGKAGKGAGLLGGAGLAGYFTLLFASLALTWLLDNWLPLEAAALITAGLWGLVALVLALTGKKDLQESNPQLPRTQQTLEEDVAWARARKS